MPRPPHSQTSSNCFGEKMCAWRHGPAIEPISVLPKFLSRKSSKKSGQHSLAALQLAEGNPFIRGVRLGDISRPKQHAWNPSRGKDPGIAEKIYPGRLCLSGGAKKLLYQWIAQAGLERTTMSGLDRTDLSGQFILA